jgi:hypothetical protein
MSGIAGGDWRTRDAGSTRAARRVRNRRRWLRRGMSKKTEVAYQIALPHATSSLDHVCAAALPTFIPNKRVDPGAGGLHHICVLKKGEARKLGREQSEGIVIAAGKCKCGPLLGSGRRRQPAETCDFEVVHAIEVFTVAFSTGGMSTVESVL